MTEQERLENVHKAKLAEIVGILQKGFNETDDDLLKALIYIALSNAEANILLEQKIESIGK